MYGNFRSKNPVASETHRDERGYARALAIDKAVHLPSSYSGRRAFRDPSHTTAVTEADKNAAVSAGAQGYLAKPFDPDLPTVTSGGGGEALQI